MGGMLKNSIVVSTLVSTGVDTTMTMVVMALV